MEQVCRVWVRATLLLGSLGRAEKQKKSVERRLIRFTSTVQEKFSFLPIFPSIDNKLMRRISVFLFREMKRGWNRTKEYSDNST